MIASDVRLRIYLSELLIENFANVHFTQTGQAALDSLKSGTYDVVVSDFYLHDMDGVEFRNHMVTTNNSPHFILLTGHAYDPKIQERLRIDSFVVQQKSPHPDELVFKIKSWFKPKKAAA